MIVDDGVATGATARVASLVARELGAASVVLAMPVGAPDSLAELAAMPEVDEVVCLSAPPGFMAVGMHYLDFRQTADAEVQAILEAARVGRADGGGGRATTGGRRPATDAHARSSRSHAAQRRPITTVAASSSSRTIVPTRPPAVTSAAVVGAWRRLVSMSRCPPGASHSRADAATRRCTSSPSPPPSSATRASWSRASGGIIAISSVGT